MVTILDGNNQVVAVATTPVLVSGQSFGARLLDLFPTKYFSADLSGKLRFEGVAKGKIIPWPKTVIAGYFPVTLLAWTE